MNGRRKQRPGWTLTELMITVAVLTILVTLAVSVVSRGQVRARVSRVKNDLRVLAISISDYQMEQGRYPNPEQHAAFSGLAGRHENPLPFGAAPVLTSPIVYYFNDVPWDPFDNNGRPLRNRVLDLSNDMLFCVGRYDYYATEKGFVLASNGPIGVPEPGITLGTWNPKVMQPGDPVVVSKVTEELYFFDLNSTLTGRPEYLKNPPGVNYVYDPTNGITSSGGIFFAGP